MYGEDSHRKMLLCGLWISLESIVVVTKELFVKHFLEYLKFWGNLVEISGTKLWTKLPTMKTVRISIYETKDLHLSENFSWQSFCYK